MKIFKKIGEKISWWWWLYVGYPLYMRKLSKKADRDLIDSVFVDID
jgi:hypothetical protein